MSDIAAIVAGLTPGQRAFVEGRHSVDGNPWPFVSMSKRSGGAAARMFARLQAAGIYDRGNCLTSLGRDVRATLAQKDTQNG